MARVLSIDPGKSKCGLVLAEINEKKVYEALVLKSELLEDYIKNLNNVEDISKILMNKIVNASTVVSIHPISSSVVQQFFEDSARK